MLRDRIQTTATSLLGLLGIEADPIRSREHILLSTIFQSAWAQGQDLTLPDIIQQIQKPPVTRVGVMDLDAFFPSSDRFTLAMALNNLLAAPGFDVWMQGEPLDIGRLLYTAEGKPRVSICSIAHLGDAERMFFVSLLLSQTVGWMRGQPGTTSLRAIVYMDEIFGYFPPVANPPSKTPLLTLLKQARAFGVGVVLATQNPGRPRLQGTREHRHVVSRPPADRTRQGSRPRRARGIGHLHWPAVRSSRDGADALGACQPDVRHAQRARGRTGGVRISVGAFVLAGTARTT